MADNDYTAAPPIDDSMAGSPDYQQQQQDTAPAPAAAPDSAPSPMLGALSGVPQAPLPDLSTPAQRPGYAGNINGQTGQAVPNAPAAPPQNKWERLFQTIAVGLSGSGNAKNFSEGLAGGARAQVNFQQQQFENQQAQQRQAMQQKQLALEEQRGMDEHQVAQAQLATAHLNQQVLAAQYNTMPKSTQDILDQVMYKQGAELQGDPNAKSVFTGSYNDAVARSQAEMTQKGQNNPLSVRVLKNPDGTFSVWDVNSPDKLNDKPTDVTIGFDFNTGKPITKTYAPGTISYAQKSQMETTAAMNIAQANNQLELHKKQSAIDTAAAGQRAYNEEAGRLKAETEVFNSSGAGKADATGFTPSLPVGGVKEYTKRQDDFLKSKEYQTLQTLRGSKQQFDASIDKINKGDFTGADSVVGLFNAIGISATPLAGKGFRINQNTVAEHQNARGLDQSVYQKLLALKSGDVITPKQLKDYSGIANQVYVDSYVNAINDAHAQGLNADFLLPRGNNSKADDATIKVFLKAAGGDQQKAHDALVKMGWN